MKEKLPEYENEGKEAVKKDDEKSFELSAQEEKELKDQIKREYKVALDFIEPRWTTWRERLKIYNNQERAEGTVGDPLMFTIHQTILASLYSDKLEAEWVGREEGDAEVAENLNFLIEKDYEDMKKAEIDYLWDWDTTFFGRGLLLMTEFDADTNCPVPEVMDPMLTLRDPLATSVRGDKKGRGGARFMGRFVRLTKRELENGEGYKNIDKVKNESSEYEKIVKPNEEAKKTAQGYQPSDKEGDFKGDNESFPLIEWFTWHDGKVVHILLANDMKVLVSYKVLEGRNTLPIIDRPLFPRSHTWDGVSISDLTEDKQRARSLLTNLALESVKAGQFPMYVYDQSRITNKADVAKYEFNKFVGIDGPVDGAVSPIERQQVKQEVNFMLESLDNSAQKATATPSSQQGQFNATQRTATENAIVQQNVDTRYSLSAKIFTWSEKEFWLEWYGLYKKYYKGGIDKKVVRISGLMGAKWRPLKRDNIISLVDPDVNIESKVVSEQKRMNELNVVSNLIAQTSAYPGTDLRYAFKKLSKLSGLKKEEIDKLFPQTADELVATVENDLLNRDKSAEVTLQQNHQQHLVVHAQANDTPATRAHITTHKTAIKLMQERPDIAQSINQGEVEGQQMERELSPGASGQAPQGQAESQNYNAPQTLQQIT